MINIFYAIYLVTFLVFLYRRTKLMTHFFQQEEYDGVRFIKYISKRLKFIDKRLSGIILLFSFSVFLIIDRQVHLSLLAVLFLVSALMHHDPCKKAKKKLVITTRVKRILSVYYSLFTFIIIGLVGCVYCMKPDWMLYLVSVVFIQLVPFLIVLANLLLKPLEKKVCNGYLYEAMEKISKLKPIVIGITGSYGKTSTKHILAHIMSSAVPSLATPGSVNTTMGITRVIREKLMSHHKYFVVEMGAYRPGSIAERCELAPPTYGIITSVGDAHYERFKTIDNVAKTKFELAQSVFETKNGKMVINNDAIDKKYIEGYTKGEEKRVIKVSVDKDSGDYVVSNGKETKDGVEFKIKIKGKSYKVKAPLHGLHQISNIALSFAMAYNIGISPESIIASLKSIPQIKHRLEVTKPKVGAIIIDNAYNSNPIGFRSSLNTLKVLKRKGGKTILITPGMVELGDLHYSKHFELGQEAGKFVDVVLAVVPKRIQAFIDGFHRTANANQKLILVDTFKDAKEWLEKNLESKDAVLYENDLPDLYETLVRI